MKKLFIFTLLTFSFLFVLASCGTSKELPVQNLSTKTIQTGNLFGAGDEGFRQEVKEIKSIDDWHDLVKKLGQVNVFETDFDAHSFGFEHKTLYFCTDKVRSTNGYSLSVSNGEMKNNTVLIHIHILSPQEMAAEVLTQPYVLFSMEKQEKVEFVFE